MSAPASWQSVVTAPAPGQHIAQLHTESGFLARAVGRFAGDGLRRGEAVVLIATPFHWPAIARVLREDRPDLEALQHRRQLTVLDAAQCLDDFLVDGMPDRTRFRASIGGAVERARAAGHGRIRAFGEMVDVLCRRCLEATIRLEELWAELLAEHGISLLCGYSLDNFNPQVHRGLLQRLSSVHSDLVPVEDYARLERAVERAYVDVFGRAGEPDALRSTFLAHYTRPAAMPDAEAAILAVQEFVPTTVEALLERVRHHYHITAVAEAG